MKTNAANHTSNRLFLPVNHPHYRKRQGLTSFAATSGENPLVWLIRQALKKFCLRTPSLGGPFGRWAVHTSTDTVFDINSPNLDCIYKVCVYTLYAPGYMDTITGPTSDTWEEQIGCNEECRRGWFEPR